MNQRRSEMLPVSMQYSKGSSPEEIAKLIQDSPSDKLVSILIETKKSTNCSDSPWISSLFEAIFVIQKKDSDILKEITNFRNILLPFCSEYKSQISLAESIEKHVHKSNLIKESPLIFKSFYDNDLLDEENIIDWYQNFPTIYESVRKQILPFIKWLKECENDLDGKESDDDDEDEEN